MGLKEHLIEIFRYNDTTNKKLISKIKLLKEPAESINLFSHLINSQNKWMARIENDPDLSSMTWWEPQYALSEMENEWTASLSKWIEYINLKSEKELFSDIKFIGNDGGFWTIKPKDIVLQLNFHSIHHRAQIQTIIRNEGLSPDFVDYIATKFKKLE